MAERAASGEAIAPKAKPTEVFKTVRLEGPATPALHWTFAGNGIASSQQLPMTIAPLFG
jgi:hypothetical protein